jgi:hypothetical protein
VNPACPARLARRLGISTTRFIAEHLEDGVYLRCVESGACGFLGPRQSPLKRVQVLSERNDDFLAGLLDLDRAVARHCAARGIAEPLEIEVRMNLHLETIAIWLEHERGGNPPT